MLSPATDDFDLFSGAGTMRMLMRGHDWSTSPLGEPSQWPRTLRITVSLMLNSKFPMFVAWGPELGFLYNDSYVEVLGVKHPAALGRPFHGIWSEIWQDINPLIERAMAGEATFVENMPLLMLRKGHEEQTYFTFSYSPVLDESGRVGGMFCACTETTRQVEADRRQAFELQMADRMRGLNDAGEITAVAAGLLGRHLGVVRVGYGEVDAAGTAIRVARDWTDGSVPSIAGMSSGLDAFGPPVFADLKHGITLRVPDVTTDARSASHANAYTAIGTRAMIVVPLIKEGRLTSILSIGARDPRAWTDEDVRVAEDVGERTWAAVERARAEGDRLRAEQALRDQLAAESSRLRTLFEQAPGFMAVVRSPEHVFELANSAYLDLVGQRELLGKSVREALPDLAGQGFFELLDRVYASGEAFSAFGAPVLIRQGAGAPPVERFVDFVYQPVTDAAGSVSGIFVEGYDVTDRLRAAQALRESEARHRTLIENISIVVWQTDGAGAMVTENNSWRAFTGQEQDSYGGWGWLDAVHPEDRERTAAVWREAIEARRSYEVSYRLLRRDGEYRDVTARGVPVWTAEGRLQEWIGNCTDITEARRAEESLREADRRKDEFLAMLAHELRNPLAPISMAAELLQMTRMDEAGIRHTSAIIARQVDHMTSLVDDLLDVSRVTRGLVTLSRETLDLGGVVADAVEQVRGLIEARHHRLTVQFAPQGALVEADRTRLIQIVTNLVNNAAKFTQEGGEILLQVDTQDDFVLLRVRDNGIGIAPELLPHVFDLFIQGERSPDRSQGGLGLGLGLVKSLVELHGGSVQVRSGGTGKGSEFTVRLPRVAGTPEGAANAQTVSAWQEAAPTKALKLMVVDDNADAAQTLAMFLADAGHEVAIAYDARGALDQARTQRPQAIVLDIGLPDMDGYELARRLRALPETRGALLIALTGYGQAQDYERSKAAGFDHHLIKPADAHALARLLDPPEAIRGLAH